MTQGTDPSVSLHHLAYNALTYIEVPRELTEILFHRLKETSDKVWLKPSREVMLNYIDLSQPGIIIKPIISGSPITVESGCPYIWKGGLCLMLLLGSGLHRLSIDVVIVCPPGTDIEKYLAKFPEYGFTGQGKPAECLYPDDAPASMAVGYFTA